MSLACLAQLPTPALSAEFQEGRQPLSTKKRNESTTALTPSPYPKIIPSTLGPQFVLLILGKFNNTSHRQPTKRSPTGR
ncbi:expressed protein [Echinococcus multilocularis]|uniref:Expressed protein n=1 Tax=Echinococcus multilocularis TaxID=6211 RepID=A0A068Y855_ECHMU|nr:expressed protein [Echinococcus multilocularis]